MLRRGGRKRVSETRGIKKQAFVLRRKQVENGVETGTGDDGQNNRIEVIMLISRELPPCFGRRSQFHKAPTATARVASDLRQGTRLKHGGHGAGSIGVLVCVNKSIRRAGESPPCTQPGNGRVDRMVYR